MTIFSPSHLELSALHQKRELELQVEVLKALIYTLVSTGYEIFSTNFIAAFKSPVLFMPTLVGQAYIGRR